MSFSGFDRSAIALLAQLPEWNATDYAAHRSTLTAGIVEPGAELISSVAAALDRDLTFNKRSSVSPLYRDLRFAPEGAARYKDHLLLTTWSGPDKKFSPTLWIRIDSDYAGFASGLALDAKLRARWRERVGADSGNELARAIAKVAAHKEAQAVDVAGPSLKKVPAPWDAEHPRADLLRLNAFQLRFRVPLPSSVEKPAFQSWCTKRLQRLLPIHDWLVENLMTTS